VIIEFEGGADLRVLQLREFSVVDHQERVVGIDVLNIALFEFGTAKQAVVVQTDDIDRLIGAAASLTSAPPIKSGTA
jgi:hypothetical protein